MLTIDNNAPAADMTPVIAAISRVRLAKYGEPESAICDAICQQLTDAGIPHRREQRFGPRCRADIWINGIVIEVKKDRPSRAALLQQIDRYASQDPVRGVIVVLEKSIPLPQALHDKPVASISLNAMWGIAL